MKRIQVLIYLLMTLCVLRFAIAQAQQGQGPYVFTIYVEEGNPNGHVFMGISDGQREIRRGWYTQGVTLPQKAKGLVGCGGGVLKDDGSTPFNVSRSYTISRGRYQRVLTLISNQEAAGKSGSQTWHPFNHCGDFVEGAAETAGLHLKLPWQFITTNPGRNRPGVFAEYLRQHGGVENTAGTASTSVSNFAGTWRLKWVWPVTEVEFDGTLSGDNNTTTFQGSSVAGQANAEWTVKQGEGQASCTIVRTSKTQGTMTCTASFPGSTEWRARVTGTWRSYSTPSGATRLGFDGTYGPAIGGHGETTTVNELELRPIQ